MRTQLWLSLLDQQEATVHSSTAGGAGTLDDKGAPICAGDYYGSPGNGLGGGGAAGGPGAGAGGRGGWKASGEEGGAGWAGAGAVAAGQERQCLSQSFLLLKRPSRL